MRDERDGAHGSKTRHVPPSVGLALRSLLLYVAYYCGSLLSYALIFPSSYFSVIWPLSTIFVSDIAMPALDGIASAGEILRRNPSARILFVTIHDDPELVQKALATSVLGYVLKLTAGDELVLATHAALRTERYVSPWSATGPANHR